MSEVNEIFRRWAQVTEQLTQAAAILGKPVDVRSRAALRSYREHLEKNEYEQAWDRLADAGSLSTASRSFWERLRTAAQLLGEGHRIDRALEHLGGR